MLRRSGSTTRKSLVVAHDEVHVGETLGYYVASLHALTYPPVESQWQKSVFVPVPWTKDTS
jgi:hypothetical protein